MRIVAVMRHAKSSWDDPDLPDRDRPLSPRGREAAPRVAAHLAARGLRPEVVLCSPSRRTRQTLALLGELAADAEVHVEEALYGASADDLQARLRQLPDQCRSVLLVGHNPACQTLVADLAGAGQGLDRVRAKFPTAAVAVLAVPTASWAALAPGQATLVELALPRGLAAEGR